MPRSNPKFSAPDETFLDETRTYLQLLNPDLKDEDFLASKVGRLKFAQPICSPRFLSTLPDISPDVVGLQIADTSYYYPEDRGVSESVRLAKAMAANV